MSTTPVTMSAWAYLMSRLRVIPGMGVLLGALSGACLAGAGFTSKLAVNVHPLEVVVFRCMLGLAIYMPISWKSGASITGLPGEGWWLIVRAIAGSSTFMLSNYAFRLVMRETN